MVLKVYIIYTTIIHSLTLNLYIKYYNTSLKFWLK